MIEEFIEYICGLLDIKVPEIRILKGEALTDTTLACVIDGIVYNLASRWWGKIFPSDCKEGKMVKLDVVAESIDKKHILIGECKWTHDDDADRLMDVLAEKAKYLPFIKKGQEVHLVLFLKESPRKMTKEMKIILPEDVIKA